MAAVAGPTQEATTALERVPTELPLIAMSDLTPLVDRDIKGARSDSENDKPE